MLPYWAVSKTFYDEKRNVSISYHDLCPRTPMLFFNHYWDGVREDPKWPLTKKMYLMPNIEMYELESKHYWQADVILCKTAICARYINKWMIQSGNPKNAQVIYTRHTSTDVATMSQSVLGNDAIAPKNFEDPVFLHTAGTRYVSHVGESDFSDDRCL